MTITISSADPVLRERILTFVAEVGAASASNAAIAGMIWREFQTIATPNQIAGIVARMGIDRGGQKRIDWTPELLGQLRELRKTGMSWRRIGQCLGMHETQLIDKYKSLGWETIKSRREVTTVPLNVTPLVVAPFVMEPRRRAGQQKARRIGLAAQTSVQGPTLAPLPKAPEPFPVTTSGRTPSAWFGGQVALPAPRTAMPDWMTRPIPRAKACLFPLWADHQRCHDVAQPFCDAPTLVTRAYDGEAKVHVYCGKHHAVAHTRMVKSVNQAPTW